MREGMIFAFSLAAIVVGRIFYFSAFYSYAISSDISNHHEIVRHFNALLDRLCILKW